MEPRLAKVGVFVGLEREMGKGGERRKRESSTWYRIKFTSSQHLSSCPSPLPHHFIHDAERYQPTLRRALGPTPAPVIIETVEEQKHIPWGNPGGEEEDKGVGAKGVGYTCTHIHPDTYITSKHFHTISQMTYGNSSVPSALG